MAARKHEVRTGTKFHYLYADSKPLWRVVKPRGGNAWECMVDESSPDWAGTKKVFGTEEIQQALAAEGFWEGLRSQRADFWESRQVGETVHYHNSFGQYVRGVIVEGEDGDGKPAKVMKPTALVGEWKDYDLPHWWDAGIYRDGGTYVKYIRNGETMQPNPGSMWESPDFSRPQGAASTVDPTTLDPIDLTPPEPTKEQAEAARLLEVVEAIRVAASYKDGKKVADWAAEYRERIASVANILDCADLGDDAESRPKF